MQVHKDIGQPAGGFVLTFADRGGGSERTDTISAIAEPMDVVEIRAARKPWEHVGKKLPLLMRGFVVSIDRSESIGRDGAPQRSVRIVGNDAGLLWLIHMFVTQVAYLDDVLIDIFKFQVANGMTVEMLPVSKFIESATENVMNVKTSKMSAISSKFIPPFNVDATVKEGMVSAWFVAQFQGQYWNLISMVADKPWNELFIEDSGDAGEETPTVVFRPSPFKDMDGKIIMQDGKDPGFVLIDDSEIVGLNMARSRNEVANVYDVPPDAGSLDVHLQVLIAQIANGGMTDFDHGNCSRELFGTTRMTVRTGLVNTEYAVLPSKLGPPGRSRGADEYQQWYIHRRDQLKKLCRDNVVWESGQISIRGNELIRPGKYIMISRGGGAIINEAYCTMVVHTLSPLQDWKTTMHLVRGNGFLLRKRQADPYFREGRRSPYSVGP